MQQVSKIEKKIEFLISYYVLNHYARKLGYKYKNIREVFEVPKPGSFQQTHDNNITKDLLEYFLLQNEIFFSRFFEFLPGHEI